MVQEGVLQLTPKFILRVQDRSLSIGRMRVELSFALSPFHSSTLVTDVALGRSEEQGKEQYPQPLFFGVP